MKRVNLVNGVFAQAQIEALLVASKFPEGFTMDLMNGALLEPGVDTGYLVAASETQDSFGDAGLSDVILHALKNNMLIGGWLDYDSGKFYWDAVKRIDDYTEAVKLARKNKQIAIYDLLQGKEIRL